MSNRLLFVFILLTSSFYLCAQNSSEIEVRLKKSYDSVECIDYQCITHFIIQKNGKEGVADKYGNVIIEPDKYTEIYQCGRGPKTAYYKVKIGNKEGACDISGRELISPGRYDSVCLHHIKDGFEYFGTERDGKEGVCDLEGKEVISPNKYTNILLIPTYNEQYCYIQVRVGNKYGVCSLDGEEVIPPIYEDVYHNDEFTGFKVQTNGTYKNYDSSVKLKSRRFTLRDDGAFPRFCLDIKTSSAKSNNSSSRSSSSDGRIRITCPSCDGTGTMFTGFGTTRCPFCGGKGYSILSAPSELPPIYDDMPSSSPSLIAPPSSSDSSERWEKYYRENYSRWENQAMSIYNSISNFSTQNSNGSITGHANHNDYGSHLATMKSNYFEAQRQMRNLRVEAQGKGITIMQSSWETTNIVTY